MVRLGQQTVEPRKAAIIAALDRWIRQRPGLEFGNYGAIAPYRAEVRSIAKDLRDALALLRYVELHDSITADMLLEAARSAYSGRLSIVPAIIGKDTDGKQVCGYRIEYCTGQYWPTEYRRAACAVLSQAIWYWTREHCMPSKIVQGGEAFYPHVDGSKNQQSAGDWLRSSLRREFGRSIANRWFA